MLAARAAPSHPAGALVTRGPNAKREHRRTSRPPRRSGQPVIALLMSALGVLAGAHAASATTPLDGEPRGAPFATREQHLRRVFAGDTSLLPALRADPLPYIDLVKARLDHVRVPETGKLQPHEEGELVACTTLLDYLDHPRADRVLAELFLRLEAREHAIGIGRRGDETGLFATPCCPSRAWIRSRVTFSVESSIDSLLRPSTIRIGGASTWFGRIHATNTFVKRCSRCTTTRPRRSVETGSSATSCNG